MKNLNWGKQCGKITNIKPESDLCVMKVFSGAFSVEYLKGKKQYSTPLRIISRRFLNS